MAELMNNYNIFKDIIDKQIKTYPYMQEQDIIKLAYQHSFGLGHIISDNDTFYTKLKKEYTLCDKNNNFPLFEDIGNNLIRLNLSVAKQNNFSVDLIYKFCLLSTDFTKDNERFKILINDIKELCKTNIYNFNIYIIDNIYKDIIINNYSPIGHSEKYRQEYTPHYCLLNSKFAPYLLFLNDIYNKLSNEYVNVTIDGRCGSGKTTFSKLLEDVFDCTVIHMDDFFLPVELRTPTRLAEAGGNVHYERFNEEVAKYLNQRNTFSYKIFDCRIMNYNKTVFVNPTKLVVIEGSYSHSPKITNYNTIKVFMDIDTNFQKQRILKRNGETCYINFKEKWTYCSSKSEIYC